mgnify:FL=1
MNEIIRHYSVGFTHVINLEEPTIEHFNEMGSISFDCIGLP